MKGKHVSLIFVSFILVLLVSTSMTLRVGGLEASAPGPLVTVHFIYVGQGDSILVDAQGSARENSVVLKLQAGETSFLLEGDASSCAEASMINAGLNLQSNVLKVGHHGSAYATTDAFLSVVQPTYAVISCGLNNLYGFPAHETMQRLSNHNVTTYGTYRSGTIIATSDGTTITFPNNPVAIPEIADVLMLTAMVVTVLLAITIKRRRALSSIMKVDDLSDDSRPMRRGPGERELVAERRTVPEGNRGF